MEVRLGVASAAVWRRFAQAPLCGLTFFIEAHASISVSSTEKRSVDRSVITRGQAKTAL